jgi:hypothetical protein
MLQKNSYPGHTYIKENNYSIENYNLKVKFPRRMHSDEVYQTMENLLKKFIELSFLYVI